jgi:hypothetical protein
VLLGWAHLLLLAMRNSWCDLYKYMIEYRDERCL